MDKENHFDKLRNEVIDQGLCTKCGTCMGVCPTKCIIMEDGGIRKGAGKCIDCGRCMESCPGKFFDYHKYNKEIYGKEYKATGILGTYRNIYVGHSVSETVRRKAASGGIVTEIAAYLIKNGLVDGVVTVAGSGNGLEFDVRIARSVQEVYDAAQSKYAIIPVNKVIRRIREEKGRYAYIGLPCQVQGIRKAMDNDLLLRERIFIIIGLFCGFNMSFGATEYLIAKSGIKKDEIVGLSYREKRGDETGFYVTDGKKEFFVKKHEYTFLNLFYAPKRCLMCYDYAAEFSDVSVGDAWELGLGWSRVIARTDHGQKILEELHENGAILIQASNQEDIEKSQRKIIDHKKRHIWYRWKRYKNVPEINIGEKPDGIREGVKGKVLNGIMAIGGSIIGRKLLYLVPFGLLRTVSRILRR